MNNKLYQKDWLMWLMLAIFIPAGIVLMWVNRRYKKIIRVIVSILYALLFIGEYSSIGDRNFSGIIMAILVFVLLPYVIVHWKQIPDKNNSCDNVEESSNCNGNNNEVYPHYRNKQNFFRRHRVFTLALAAILFVTGIYIGTRGNATNTTQNQSSVASKSSTTQSKPSNATVSAQPTKEKTWVDVTKFEGNGIKNTEKFNIDSDEWRIVWSTQPGDAGKQNFQIYVNDKDGELTDVAANIVGQGNDISYMNKGGEYSLKIISGQPYTITIQEKK